VLAFYTTYVLGLGCLFAALAWAFGLPIALLLSVAIPVSWVLLWVLCSAPAERERGPGPTEGGRSPPLRRGSSIVRNGKPEHRSRRGSGACRC
jgi:hypothetical protein